MSDLLDDTHTAVRGTGHGSTCMRTVLRRTGGESWQCMHEGHRSRQRIPQSWPCAQVREAYEEIGINPTEAGQRGAG